MTEVIPAFLEKDFSEIERKAALARGLVKAVQLDVMDGVFVPDTTWPYEEGRQKGFERLLEGDVPLPFWQDFEWEVDMMIQDPEEDISEWLKTGVSRVIVHVESTKLLDEIIDTYGKNMIAADPREEGFLQSIELGLALNTKTPNEVIEPYVERVNFIQFMGIAEIGAQGQEFDSRVFEKIRDLRAEHSDVTISVDGGVSLENAPRLIEVGANRLVSGSAIWKSESPKETIKRFKSL